VTEGQEGRKVQLYSAGQVAGASFIGAPIGGAILLARNYAVLGNPAASRRALLWGSAGTVALLALAYVLPDGFPSRGIPMGYTVGMYHLAKQVQGDLFTSHITQGGGKRSTWVAVGIGALSLVGVLTLAFSAALVAVLAGWVEE
jgi:hypothetical protein